MGRINHFPPRKSEALIQNIYRTIEWAVKSVIRINKPHNKVKTSFLLGAVFFGLFLFSVWGTFLCYLLHFGANTCTLLNFGAKMCHLHCSSIFPWFPVFPWCIMVFIHLPKVFIDLSILFIEFSMIDFSMVSIDLFHA